MDERPNLREGPARPGPDEPAERRKSATVSEPVVRPVDEEVVPDAGATDEAELADVESPRNPAPRYVGRHYEPAPGENVEIADPGAAFDPSTDTSLVGHLQSIAEPVANVVEPIVENIVLPVAGAIGNVIDAATTALGVKDAINDRLIHRSAPLPNLYEVHPEAREASPRELGFRFIPIEDIRGTAVAGAAQRGLDFRPLPPFRGSNWEGRWQRIRDAYTHMRPLPPVDLIKFDGDYWVVDGHNRVAATIDTGGVGVDAMIVELVPLDGRASEHPSSVLPFIGEAGGALRMAATGRTPAVGTQVSVPTMPLPPIESTSDSGRSEEAAE